MADATRDPAGGAVTGSLDIAVVGMAARFPRARDVDTFWRRLQDGVCCVTFFDDEELRAAGVPQALLENPRYVKVGLPLDGIELFDAGFFGYSPREAELMDPQHRLLLECAWEAVENAGYDVGRYDGLVGVYAGGGMNTYLMFNLGSNPEAIDAVGAHQVKIGNSNDFLASRISYKLGLEGPSINVQSACSSSLVAVALACQGLLDYQCDMALAGGVAVDVLKRHGYVFEEDGLFSPDGYCRAFDAQARGTIGGNGVGLVVLKRLEDGVADGDHVHAVIKGWAVNNDGSLRAGFTAPGENGQALAITTALASADVDPDTVGYVEAHGTGTIVGDPIELAALTAAFRSGTSRRGYCALGSVKTNVGHLDAAAGVAGLIKAVLAVETGQIPATLHYSEPNPRFDIEASPFFVNTELSPWPVAHGPRRAGVNSFGLGGTNAHVVLEQAPAHPVAEDAPSPQVIVLSAKTEAALEAATANLAAHLRRHPEQPLADVAYTLQLGRKPFSHRRFLAAGSVDEALSALDARDDGRLLSSVHAGAGTRPVAFLFTGFGDHYPNMARQLYEQESVFRAALDVCAALVEPFLDRDLRSVLFDERAAGGTLDLRALIQQPEQRDHLLDRPSYGYPAMFAVEYALVALWRSWGIEPTAMIGHSLGEYVAACIAGVFSNEDALRLVVERARLIERQPEGAMLAVPLTESDASKLLGPEVALAAVNTPRTCVLSGTPEAVYAISEQLSTEGVASRRLTTRFAFHSEMMDPILDAYAEVVETVSLSPPRIRFVSNVSGTWIEDREATDPRYWVEHARRTVRFADGVATLWDVPHVALLEVGPGQTLTSTALQHPVGLHLADRVAVPSLPPEAGGASTDAFIRRALGQLWLAGAPVAWNALHGPGRRRVPLPSYPFERQRYWIEANPHVEALPAQRRETDPSAWFSTPSWQRAPGLELDGTEAAREAWLVFVDEGSVGEALAGTLRGRHAGVTTVVAGDRWDRPAPDRFLVDPCRLDHFEQLAAALRDDGRFPDRIVHCWSVGRDVEGATSHQAREALLDRSFYSLLYWARAAETELLTRAQRWDVVSSELHAVTGDERLCPVKASLQGICRVAPQEYTNLRCQQIDIVVPDDEGAGDVVDRLLLELLNPDPYIAVALRGAFRWRPTFEPLALPAEGAPRLRDRGVYLITGGLGRIGLVVARSLADQAGARLALVSRRQLPPRSEWPHSRGDDTVAQAISAIEDLEARGAEVLLCSADVSDEQAMKRVVADTLRRFGTIDGVIHSAGAVGADVHRVLAASDRSSGDPHFGSKLHGAYALQQALEDQRPDFVLLFSSIASILGGLGFGAYAGANASLDAFAHLQRQRGLLWTSVDWEAWDFVGRDAGVAGIGTAVQDLALDPEEGKLVFESLLRLRSPAQVVVSTTDIDARSRLWANPLVTAVEPERRHPRPNLRNPYVASAPGLESDVANAWQRVLGLEEVGVHDNFFELGGSSLLGLQVVHQLREALDLPLPLTVVYEGPTVRTLTQLIDSLRGTRDVTEPELEAAR